MQAATLELSALPGSPNRRQPPKSRMVPTHNALIRLLPAVDRRQLLARAEPVTLTLSQVLCEGHSTLRHAYFPVSGFVSLVVGVDEPPSLEVGMVGQSQAGRPRV